MIPTASIEEIVCFEQRNEQFKGRAKTIKQEQGTAFIVLIGAKVCSNHALLSTSARSRSLVN